MGMASCAYANWCRHHFGDMWQSLLKGWEPQQHGPQIGHEERHTAHILRCSQAQALVLKTREPSSRGGLLEPGRGVRVSPIPAFTLPGVSAVSAMNLKYLMDTSVEAPPFSDAKSSTPSATAPPPHRRLPRRKQQGYACTAEGHTQTFQIIFAKKGRKWFSRTLDNYVHFAFLRDLVHSFFKKKLACRQSNSRSENRQIIGKR